MQPTWATSDGSMQLYLGDCLDEGRSRQEGPMTTCPKCNAPRLGAAMNYVCGSRGDAGLGHRTAQCRLNEIVRLCQRHCVSASNPEAYGLAAMVLDIAVGDQSKARTL